MEHDGVPARPPFCGAHGRVPLHTYGLPYRDGDGVGQARCKGCGEKDALTWKCSLAFFLSENLGKRWGGGRRGVGWGAAAADFRGKV